MNEFFEKIISLSSLEKIAEIFEKIISLIAFLSILIILFIALVMLIIDGPLSMFYALVVGFFAWVLSFGTIAIFIKIYQHVKSIDNKLS